MLIFRADASQTNLTTWIQLPLGSIGVLTSSLHPSLPTYLGYLEWMDGEVLDFNIGRPARPRALTIPETVSVLSSSSKTWV